jgi:hypothetical protein
MANKVCIAIAVSRPEGLDEVPGAILSAKRVIEWAEAQGFDTELVTDKAEPVTCARLREVFVRKLGQGGQQRLIVSFAGHGLIRGGAEEYWLLSNWQHEATEAVNYLKLRDRLGTYLPKQLAVISDACRSLPNPQAKWVEGNGVVPVKDYVEKPVQVVHLAGTRAAQPSFATPIGAEEAYCFFTQVLVNALWGDPSDAVEVHPTLGRVVTNDRLLRTVVEELPKLAGRYNRTQTPDLQGGWWSPENVWSVLGKFGPVGFPAFVVPPAPGPPQPLGPSCDEVAKERASAFHKALQGEQQATHFKTRTGIVIVGDSTTQVVLGPNFEATRDDGGPEWFRVTPGGVQAATVLVQLSDRSWVAAAVYRDFIGTFSIRRNEDEGGHPAYQGADSYVLRPSGGLPSIAELAISQAATGGALSDPSFIKKISLESRYSPVEPNDASSDPYDLAAVLRDYKHTDPVLGAMAAYAYARAGAVEEIRRLTYFYAQHDQPAPFDAVLLARVPIKRDGLGYLAQIPAVAGREPRSDIEKSRGFTYRATPAGSVWVAGSFPWLRQGWALLEDDFRPEFRKLARFATQLRPSVFTTFTPDAGEEIAKLVREGKV